MKTHDHVAIVQLKEKPVGGSDATLKKEVTPLSGTLEKILALRPVTWYWKADKSNKKLRYGFIAQEVEEVLPNLVTEEKWQGDETVQGDQSLRKHLSTNDMMPYVVGAVKDQHVQITELIATYKKQQQEIAQLTNIIETLKNR